MARPWKGKHWGDPTNALGGFRLIILGESHYHPTAPVGSDVPEMTEQVVDHYLSGQHYQFFSRLKSLATPAGKDIDADAFMQSIVFYNYIPQVAANLPRQRPPEHLWHGDAPVLFDRLVREVEAEAILVCGTQLWRKMSTGLIERVDAYRAGGRSWRDREYEVALPHRAVAAHIPHPSSFGWKLDRSVPVIEHLRARASGMRAEFGHPQLL